jgi:hypothetical protein
MLNKTGKTQRKQLSRGQRKHVRRMKQEARKGSVLDSKVKKAAPAPAIPKP